MSLVPIDAVAPLAKADARLVDVAGLERALREEITGEVRFDKISRALYSTDASVYRIEPLGLVVPKNREDVIAVVRICRKFACPITMRGGGTSQAGQAIGEGIIVDLSKYYNRLLELNLSELWVRVEPGIVLDELNSQLKSHGVRFAPDISTASRATIGGMMANNSSGARSVLYGKTIDHVLEQEVVLSDGSVVWFRDMIGQELDEACSGDSHAANCYRSVIRIARECADEIEARFPKVLRRVGGYNLDAFTDPSVPVNLTKLLVGSEGTLGIVLQAKLRLVPLPKVKAVMAIQFADTLDALAATPVILRHRPSAVEVMDKFILDHTKSSAALQKIRSSFVVGDPAALLCVEFYDDAASALPPRLKALEDELRTLGLGYHFHPAMELSEQARVWSLREAALGLSMAMKDDAKSISFVEDTAVAPEKLRDYIERFLALLTRHGTSAGLYAHASVGCLHVRPVVNLKTDDGIRKFEAIASDVADLVLEFGGALSGEHGDGLVRSPFMRKMFGARIYEAFRNIKAVFDPAGIFNPGKIVDSPGIAENLRLGTGYITPAPPTYFDYSEYGGMGGAVEMCSGLGACRKKLDGTMCPSYMATSEEAHSTRGRANVLRLAMTGRLGEAGLGDDGVQEVLDLCLECRACKAECPVGVDVARFKSEFLADYQARHGATLHARMLAGAHEIAHLGSGVIAQVANAIAGSQAGKWANERFFGIDRRRALPQWSTRTLRDMEGSRPPSEVHLFVDTFTDCYEPEIGVAALQVFESGGIHATLANNVCCGRPLISKGFLARARERSRENTRRLLPAAEAGHMIVFLEPSCLSAVKEDAPSLLRDDEQKQAQIVASACVSFEDFIETEIAAGKMRMPFSESNEPVLFHAHCHQKSMGLHGSARVLLSRLPGSSVTDPDAGCCGMAGSFGYSREHFEVSRAIGERRLFPAVRAAGPRAAIVASGFSCRHQIKDFTSAKAVHPAVLLRSRLAGRS